MQAGYATAELEFATPQPLSALADRWRQLHSPIVLPDPQVVEGFGLLANHLVSPLTDPLRHLDQVRRNPAWLATLPDRYGSFLEARVFWSNPAPGRAVAASPFRTVFVVSTPPGMPPERYFDAILADARSHGITVVESFLGGVTAASPYPTPFTETLRRVTEAHFPGVPFGPLPTFGSFSTSMLFRRRVSDLRLQPHSHEHHGYGPATPQRRAGLLCPTTWPEFVCFPTFWKRLH